VVLPESRRGTLVPEAAALPPIRIPQVRAAGGPLDCPVYVTPVVYVLGCASGSHSVSESSALHLGGRALKRVGQFLGPVSQGGKYTWPELEVKVSTQGPGAGQGLFARTDLPPGTLIPIVGQILSEAEAERRIAADTFTHGFQYSDGTCIDGGRELDGQTIWAKINEPLTKKPNCIFKLDCVVTGRRIRAGEELTVYYGSSYTRDGYSLDGNRHLQGEYPSLKNMRWPSVQARRTLQQELNVQ